MPLRAPAVSIAAVALCTLAACDGAESKQDGGVQAAGIASGAKLSPSIARNGGLLRPNNKLDRREEQPDKNKPKPAPEPPISGAEEGPLVGLRAAHNSARAKVGVEPLAWSKTVAISAQEWANHLAETNDCQLAHDPERSYGENLYMRSSSTGGLVEAEEVVSSWTAEAAHYDAATHSCQAGQQCGHYTQVVWAETRDLGCGVATCTGSPLNAQVWVCRYDPHGNVHGKQPF